MLYHIVSHEKIFNWSDLVSQQLKINVNKAKIHQNASNDNSTFLHTY